MSPCFSLYFVNAFPSDLKKVKARSNGEAFLKFQGSTMDFPKRAWIKAQLSKMVSQVNLR